MRIARISAHASRMAVACVMAGSVLACGERGAPEGAPPPEAPEAPSAVPAESAGVQDRDQCAMEVAATINALWAATSRDPERFRRRHAVQEPPLVCEGIDVHAEAFLREVDPMLDRGAAAALAGSSG